MNQHDWELLDKQLSQVHPRPPVNRGELGFAFVGAFISGLFVGGLLFAHQMQMTPHNQMMAVFDANSSPTTIR